VTSQAGWVIRHVFLDSATYRQVELLQHFGERPFFASGVDERA
jgi:hypothetical protein